MILEKRYFRLFWLYIFGNRLRFQKTCAPSFQTVHHTSESLARVLLVALLSTFDDLRQLVLLADRENEKLTSFIDLEFIKSYALTKLSVTNVFLEELGLFAAVLEWFQPALPVMNGVRTYFSVARWEGE